MEKEKIKTVTELRTRLSGKQKRRIGFRNVLPLQQQFENDAAGGGKSHLMRILAIMCCLYVPGLLVYLFRRYSGDFIQNHFNGPTGFPELLAPFIEAGYCKISYSPHACINFWNGAKITACHCQYEKDVERFRGAEIHLLLIDELTLGLFVFDHCRNFIRTVPSLQYAQNGDDDVDTTQEDHLWDCPRYRVNLRIGGVVTSDVFA